MAWPTRRRPSCGGDPAGAPHAERPEEQRRTEAAALLVHLLAVRSSTPVTRSAPTSRRLGAGLGRAARFVARGGVRVLLPVARQTEAGLPVPLAWGEYRRGSLVRPVRGLREPAAPWLPPRQSERRPRGGACARRGSHRRAAGSRRRVLRPVAAAGRPGGRLVAVVRDDELVDELPPRAMTFR